MFKKKDLPWLKEEISCQIEDFCRKCRQPKSETLLEQETSRLADEVLSEIRVRDQIKSLKEYYGSELKGKKLLEIGSGYATFLIGARLWEEIDALGTEPALFQCDNLKLPKKVLRAGGVEENVFFGAQGEQLPFRSCFFDVIYSHNVLEHVEEPQKVLNEAFRVLKPGGKMVIIVPNYFTFWEGHYKIFWSPIFNWRPLGRAYVRLMGKDPNFLDSLNLVTHRKLLRWLSSINGDYEILGTGVDVWRRRLMGEDFAPYGGMETAKQLFWLFRKCGLANLIARTTSFLNMHTPIVLTLKKISDQNQRNEY